MEVLSFLQSFVNFPCHLIFTTCVSMQITFNTSSTSSITYLGADFQLWSLKDPLRFPISLYLLLCVLIQFWSNRSASFVEDFHFLSPQVLQLKIVFCPITRTLENSAGDWSVQVVRCM